MNTKELNTEQTKESDELTLEDWREERRKMEEQMAADSAELKAAMDDALANDDLPPEMKAVIQETGIKMLDADEWLHEMYDSTEETIKRCDELIEKVNSMEKQQ